MTQVQRITTIEGHRIFLNFTWPAELPAFGKYNLIYGGNGTGKTTLSRLFRSLEQRVAVNEGRVVFEVDGKEIAGTEFNEASVSLRVFNRDFVRDSVFTTGDVLEPIIVLGSDNRERQQELEQLQLKHTALTEGLRTQRSDLAQRRRDLESLGTSVAARIKDALRTSNLPTYANYDRRNFNRRADTMALSGDRESYRVSEDAHAKLLMQASARAKASLPHLESPAGALTKATEQVEGLLARSVTVEAIEQLAADSDLESWVHAGLTVHRDRGIEHCLFCGEILGEARIAALERHFNDEYEGLVRDVDHAIAELATIQERLRDADVPRQAQFFDELATDFAAIEPSVQAAIRAASLRVRGLGDLLVAKKRSPLRSSVLPDGMTSPDFAAFDAANALVDRHNAICEDLTATRTSAAEWYESGIVESVLDEFIRLKSEAERLQAAADAADAELATVSTDITAIEQTLHPHHVAAEQLNQDLARYLGHDELTLSVKKTGYGIARRGEPTSTLSEGEQTAIALLHFLKSLEDDRRELANTIVVLDDPVSSLDSNALYLAFGFIRDRASEVGQLIILTHNFTLFRQVRNWFHHMPGQRRADPERRPARFFMVDCRLVQGRRISQLTALDPLLERYQSEYHYLFARVSHAVQDPALQSLEAQYVLPNMARRLLEAFLSFRYPQISGELSQQLDLVEFDPTKKHRILRFVHTYSHAGAIDEPDHDLSHLTEGGAVLHDLLDLMETVDSKHVEAMRALVTSQEEVQPE